MTKIIFFAFLLISILGACSNFKRAQKSADLQEKYGYAMKYYEKHDYYKAGVLFEELIPLMKGHEMAEKAQFFYSNCQYKQQNYTMSSFYYKKFVDTYPRSQYAEEALFMHGKSLFMDSPEPSLDQTNTYGALDGIQAFLNTYPNSQYKEECNQIVDQMRRKLEVKAYDNTKLYYKIGDYKAAIVGFNNFKNEYPSSEYNEEFAFLKIDAQHQYASKSIDIKQIERYTACITFYEEFVDKYPQSGYLRQAIHLYDDSVSKIEKLKAKLNLK